MKDGMTTQQKNNKTSGNKFNSLEMGFGKKKREIHHKITIKQNKKRQENKQKYWESVKIVCETSKDIQQTQYSSAKPATHSGLK